VTRPAFRSALLSSSCLVAAALAAVSPAAWAEPVPSAVASRISPRGLRFLEDQVNQLAPTSLTMPDLSHDLSSFCGSEPTTVYISGARATLHLDALEVIPDQDKLTLRIQIDLDAEADTRVTNALSCLGGEISCHMRVAAQDAQVSVTLDVLGDAGGVFARFDSAQVQLTPALLQVDATGCALGNTITQVVDTWKSYVVAMAKPQIEQMISDQLSPRLSEAMSQVTTRLGGFMSGFHYALSLSGLLTDPDGVTVRADVDLDWLGNTAACLPQVPVARPNAPVAPDFGGSDAHVGVAISTDLVNRALDAVWRSGRMCADAQTIANLLDGLNVPQLINILLELPLNTEVDLAARADVPPVLRATGSSPAGLRASVDFDHVTVVVFLRYPDGTTGQIEVAAQAGVDVDLGLASDTNAFSLQVSDMHVKRVDIVGSTGVLFRLDSARLEQVARDLVLPKLADKLSSLPLSAPVLSASLSPLLAQIYVLLNDVGADDHYIYAFVDLFLFGGDDRQAPETSIDGIPPVVVHAGMAHLLVAGTDDRTPARLLRYRSRLDGGTWSAPSYDRNVWVTATDGRHSVEVVAVDLNGNVDPTPVMYVFEVDGHPPDLQIIRKPADIERGRSIEVELAGHDDRTSVDKLAYRWRLRRVNEQTALTETVSDIPFQTATTKFKIPLPGDGSYALELAVSDEAGNLTSTELHFAAVLDTSCAALPAGGLGPAGTGRAALPLVLAILALCARRARRGSRNRRSRWGAPVVFLAASLAIARPAAATEIGNVFSGTSEPGATSTFLNPAALGRQHGTWLLVDGGLTWITAAYQRPGIDPGTGQGYSLAELGVPKPEVAAVLSSDALFPRLHAAIGLTAPFIDGVDWKPPPGGGLSSTTYHADFARTLSIYVTPALVFEILPQLHVGAGLNLVYTSVQKRFSKDFSTQINAMAGAAALTPENPALSAPAQVVSDGWTTGYSLGVEVAPRRWLRLGLGYVSGTTQDLAADLTLGSAVLLDVVRNELHSRHLELALHGSGTITWRNPQVINFGITFEPRDRWELGFDFEWLDSSAIGVIETRFTERSSQLIPAAFVATRMRDDDYQVVGRLSYRARPNLRAVLRLSYDADEIPEELVNPNNVNFPILEVGLGAEWTLRKDVRLIFEYRHYIVFSRDVTRSHYVENPQTSDAFDLPPGLGHYSAGAERAGISLAWRL
jgi:long-subunit fatty acid transport protein